jgi:D-alanine-D-alanine ligase
MRIGITYDLKPEITNPGPDDLHEEFDSPQTVSAIADALRELGHQVEELGDGRELAERLLASPPDFVFNMAEGQGVGRAREARVPALLEMLGIPYTGSDPLTLAVTLDKDCAKRLVRSAGVAVPEGRTVHAGSSPAANGFAPFRFPVIVKPAWEGSSKGIRSKCLVERPDDLGATVESLGGDYRQPVLVEEYVEGDELTVGLLGNGPPRILGVMRITPRNPQRNFIYGLDVKRDFLRQVEYECPARLPEKVLRAVGEAAVASFEVLGCRDVARIDFRLRDGVPYFLEANPLPGLNPETSDLVIMARLCGWSHSRLVHAIWEAAQRRTEEPSPRTEAARALTAGPSPRRSP